MPTVAQLVKEASKLKVKEVPSHVQKFAGQHWTPSQLQARVSNWMQNYKTQVRRPWGRWEGTLLLAGAGGGPDTAAPCLLLSRCHVPAPPRPPPHHRIASHRTAAH